MEKEPSHARRGQHTQDGTRAVGLDRGCQPTEQPQVFRFTCNSMLDGHMIIQPDPLCPNIQLGLMGGRKLYLNLGHKKFGNIQQLCFNFQTHESSSFAPKPSSEDPTGPLPLGVADGYIFENNYTSISVSRLIMRAAEIWKNSRPITNLRPTC